MAVRCVSSLSPSGCHIRHCIRLTASSERGNVLQRSSLGGSGSNDDSVLHGVVLLEGLDELSNSGSLLTDGDVDAVQLLLLVGT